MEEEWKPIGTLPPPGERPGRVFVVVEGSEYHSGINWRRQADGIARTRYEGFYPSDIAEIETDNHMDPGTGVVTHWLPYRLPHLPR